MLLLAEPINADPLSVRTEPAPEMRMSPVFAIVSVATDKPEPVTVAPLRIESVPLVPATLDTSTEIFVKLPPAPLLKVSAPMWPFCPTDSEVASSVEPAPLMPATPLPPKLPIFTVPAKMSPPVVAVTTVPPPMESVVLVEKNEPAPITEIVAEFGVV